ncbi:imidazole glycerol phosphate synthase subunit HisH [Alphaproteobacteria bacterium]|nr:imidazole glycerol phosphate synthase subunit HisH [Alphaproteobacteria bacterium]
MGKVVIIDYGASNTLSVNRAFSYLGANVVVSNDAQNIASAERLVLPGVGAFPDSMNRLKADGLAEVVKHMVSSGKPIIGICLGMQMLFTKGLEFEVVEGLGLIDGDVVKISNKTICNKPLRVPNVGWRSLNKPNADIKWEGTPLEMIDEGRHVYFVHSYKVAPSDPSNILAISDYGGQKIPSVIKKDNIFGCQFHPEKSGPVGLSILEQFLSAH